jgi:magnesium transporter
LSWLMVNLLTAVAASIVIGLFEDTIQRIVALAVLMPIVASMGGNAGTQTVTVAVRALALRQLSRATIMGFVLRELSVGFINGLIFAITAGLVSYFWFGDMSLALVMAVAMLANLVIAGVSGTAIPLTLTRFGVDPAVASSVFITTVTDVVGFMTFLGLAAYFLL